MYVNGELVTDLVIPEGVTSIGNYAFYGCGSIESITVPEGVEYVGCGAFGWCNKLTSVNWNAKNASSGENRWGYSYECIFYYAGAGSYEVGVDVIFGDKVESIPEDLFTESPYIKSVHIGKKVKTIGGKLFSYLKNTDITVDEENKYFSSVDGNLYNKAQTALIKYMPGKTATSFAIPESVATIGDYAFYDCSGLTSITIPEGVTSIGDNAFSGCWGLTSVAIPESVTSVGNYAFYGCDSLEPIYITDLTAWCGIEFGNATANPLYYAKKLYINGELATDMAIPEGVTTIGSYAFYNCTGLKSVTFPEGVTSIGNYAFRYNNSLTVYFIGTEAEWQNISGYRNVSASKFVYTPRLCAEYTGDYIDTISVIKGEDVVLPVPPEGYVYRFASNGEEWDGKNITSDVTVTVTKLCDMCDIIAVGDCRDLAVNDGKLTASTYFGTIECDKIELSEGAAAKVYGDETCSGDTLDTVASDGSTVFIVVTAQSGRSATYAASFTHTPVADLGEIEFTYSAGGYVALRLKNEVPGEPKIFAAYSKNGEDYTYAETDYSRENGAFSISGLEEGTRYFVKAAADYRTGEYVYSDVIEFVTEKTLSNECEITKIVSPSIYDYDESAKTITAKAANRFAEYPVDVEVSDGATWGLYLSRNATLRLEGNKLPLAEGKYKTGYIKVFAGDGVTENIYTIKIYRQKKSAVPEIAVSDGNVTITAPEDTVVWYTTDNSTPVPNLCGKVYDGAFPAETGTVIKAIALNPGFEEYSDVAAFVVSSGEKAELELLELSVENSAAAFECYLMTKDGSDLNGRFYFAAYGEKGRLLNAFDTPVEKSASECVMSGTLNVSEAPAYVKAFFWGGESGVEPLGKAVETPVGE